MLAGIAEGERFVARACIGHGADDGNAKALVISYCGRDQGAGTCCFLAGEADAEVIIDLDMNTFPTYTPAIGFSLSAPLMR